MVVVASRPVATSELKKKCKTRLEVVGFSKDQIYDYVRSYPFGDSSPSKAYKMIEFLDLHPNVFHMCYLPVHATMICFLFFELKGNIPHRETQIYEQFVIATILKYKARKGDVQQLKSLRDLSGEEKELFQSVCKLAFDMTINSQQVVSKSNAQFYLFIDSALGLLTVERTVKYYGSEDFYTFSHLTLQEFLAAFYISEAQMQDEALIENMALHNVWKFYSGLVQSDSNVEVVEKIIEEEEDRFSILYKVQCAFESQQVKFCNYLVEDGMLNVYGRSVLVITSADFVALGYVVLRSTKRLSKIALSSNKWDREGIKAFISMATNDKLRSIKCLKVYFENDEDVHALNRLLFNLPSLEELNLFFVRLDKSKIESLSSGVTLANLRLLKISLPLVPCSHPEKVLENLRFGSRNTVQLLYSFHEGPTIDHILWKKMLCYSFGYQSSDISWLHVFNSDTFSLCTHDRLCSCTEVVFVNCHFGDDEAELLTNSLNPFILQKLVLDFNRITDPGAVALAGCLSICRVVQEVSIQCNSIGDSGATALAETLNYCTSLRRLDLQGNNIGDKGAVAIAKAVGHLPCLDLYLHNVNITEEGIERVLEHRATTKIRSMQFTSTWYSVSEVDIDTLGSALYCGNIPALTLTPTNFLVIKELINRKHLRNVKGLVCNAITDDIVPTICAIIESINIDSIKFRVDISSSSAQCLSDSLKGCKSLRNVVILNHMTHPCLLDAVKCCSKLHSIDLKGINSDGVKLLFGNHMTCDLQTLNLRNNIIGADDIQVLSEVLRNNNLLSLDLSHNDIGDDGAVAIADGLQGHTCLLDLRLADNFISSDGMTALLSVIRRNRLQHLNLSGNVLGSEDVAALVDALNGDTLQSLNISNNSLDENGIESLTLGLKKFKQLQVLNLERCGIGSHGIVTLSKGIQYCINLRDLDLTSNAIASSGIPAILDIMKSCRYLQCLGLNWNHISVDAAANAVSGWQHKNILTLELVDCFNYIHEFALIKNEKCCSSCDHLLEVYYSSDYVRLMLNYTSSLPTLVSSKI